MVLDISNIITGNTLFSLRHGDTIQKAYEVLSIKYIEVNDYDPNHITLIIDDIQMFFNKKLFDFGVIKFWRSGEDIYCLDNKINYQTTLETMRAILDDSNISYTENETNKDNQLNLNLENGAVLVFAPYCYAKTWYKLVKIKWGKDWR